MHRLERLLKWSAGITGALVATLLVAFIAYDVTAFQSRRAQER